MDGFHFGQLVEHLAWRPARHADGGNGGMMLARDRFADLYGTGLLPEFSDTVDTFLA